MEPSFFYFFWKTHVFRKIFFCLNYHENIFITPSNSDIYSLVSHGLLFFFLLFLETGESDEHPGKLPGDIVFILKEKEHTTFKRRNADLLLQKKITLVEALTVRLLCFVCFVCLFERVSLLSVFKNIYIYI